MHVSHLLSIDFLVRALIFFLHVNDTQTKTGVGFAINGL